MSDEDNQAETVGSVGEEAAKLFGALSDWAREQGGEYAGSASGAAGAFADAVKDVKDHVATESEDCRYCPVCQVIHVVRQTSPEVRTHLAVAASSLIQAAAGVLATHAPDRQSNAPVEKIDLDAGWDDEQ
ncbi:MAG: hypothetical protein ABIN79_01335 [Marmoricola sp.]